MPDDWRIEASAFGCFLALCGLGYAMSIYGAAAVGFWYFGPLLITNAYLILYTWLQHTHPDVPHFGSDEFSRLKGALSTIDRPYMWIVDHCHHRASRSLDPVTPLLDPPLRSLSSCSFGNHFSDSFALSFAALSISFAALSICARRHRDDARRASPLLRCAVLPRGCADRSYQANTR